MTSLRRGAPSPRRFFLFHLPVQRHRRLERGRVLRHCPAHGGQPSYAHDRIQRPAPRRAGVAGLRGVPAGAGGESRARRPLRDVGQLGGGHGRALRHPLAVPPGGADLRGGGRFRPGARGAGLRRRRRGVGAGVGVRSGGHGAGDAGLRLRHRRAGIPPRPGVGHVGARPPRAARAAVDRRVAVGRAARHGGGVQAGIDAPGDRADGAAGAVPALPHGRRRRGQSRGRQPAARRLCELVLRQAVAGDRGHRRRARPVGPAGDAGARRAARPQGDGGAARGADLLRGDGAQRPPRRAGGRHSAFGP